MEGLTSNRLVPPPDVTDLTADDIAAMGSSDGEFYCHHFFPKAFRQESPEFHFGEHGMWGLLDNPANRQVALESFRGSAKTTLARTYLTKRISYALSNTVMVVGESQDQAKRTTRWVRRQVMYNRKWTSFFGIEKGEKWTDEWCEIVLTKVLDDQGNPHIITLLAVGMTGQLRGINIDDWRPDFILADDPCDEENTGTETQLKKMEKLFFGSLLKTMAPRSEAPLATMALLQTPLAPGDLISIAKKDPTWAFFHYGCFDKDGKSAWEARFPSRELQKDKQDHINRNQIVLWLREMECVITSELTASFRGEWLMGYELITLPSRIACWMGIDPVPPPSDAQLERKLQGKDFEALSIVGFIAPNFYLLDYMYNRGHEPDWTVQAFWTLVDRWHPQKVRVEGVAYQRTLKWILDQSMRQRKRYVQVDIAPDDKRKKVYRVQGSLNGIAASKRFYIDKERHSEFITQFITFPDCENDDIIESVAIAAAAAQEDPLVLEGEWEALDDNAPQLKHFTGGWAP